jgi:hypothetical protein
MEILKGELFLPYGQYNEATIGMVEREVGKNGRRTQRGLSIQLVYLEDEQVLINPIPDEIKDWLTPQLKARVFVSINPLQEHVMGVAGKDLKETYTNEYGEKAYWIIEKFIRMEHDDFSYRILKYDIELCHELGIWNFCIAEKRLFESNWNSYPRNIVLNKMVKKIEGEIIARRIS